MSDAPESRRFFGASRPRHRLTLRSLEPAPDLGPFTSPMDEFFQVPAELDPWEPEQSAEIPWELREDA